MVARKAVVVIQEMSGTKEKSTLYWDNRKGVLALMLVLCWGRKNYY